MDLDFSAEDEAYRQRLRAWLAENVGKRQEAGGLMKVASGGGGGGGNPIDAARGWQRRLYEAGYVGLAWPEEYGGQGASFTEQVICAEELAKHRAPPLINTIGLSILGPTLVQHGTEEQKRHFLPRILRAEDLWCQGFSEPEAGSDLASLRTRAVIDDDDFVVTGQKVWTSLAPIADWMFLLVRTDPDAHKRAGISYLLCDMKTPGLTVRPLRNAAGGIHFSEVFLDEVRIPRSQLVGELNGGWAIARSTLDHERSGLSGVIALEETLSRLWRLAGQVERGRALGPARSGHAPPPRPALDRDRGPAPPRLPHADGAGRRRAAGRRLLGRQALRLRAAPAHGHDRARDARPARRRRQEVAPRRRPGPLARGLLRRARPQHRGRHERDHAQRDRREGARPAAVAGGLRR